MNIQKGQKVHCALYGGNDGIIYNVRGEQRPETIQGLAGGAVMMGGNAFFDVVFENGTKSPGIPESIVWGVQWKIYDEIATPEEIETALKYAEETRKQTEAEARKGAEEKETLTEKIKCDYPYLEKYPGPSKSKHVIGASNIRTELKRTFPGVKFSVRSESYSGGCSINIDWTDGPTGKQVEEIANKYQYGYFDGMEDLYHYSRDPWADIYGGAKYVFCARSLTNERIQAMADKMGHAITFSQYGEIEGIDYETARDIRNQAYQLDYYERPFVN